MAHEHCILLGEDDENDAKLFKIALSQAGVSNPLHVLPNGLEVINYLAGSGTYANRSRRPWPALLLLDLKMPLVDGFQVLEWLHLQRPGSKARKLPVIIMSSSSFEPDMRRAMDLGAVAYCVKPARLEYLVQVAHNIRDHWLKPGLALKRFADR